jgi:hypothetical protein
MVGLPLTMWMFFSERMERPLLVFLLYLGLLDGFLKLRTNSTAVTSVRDVLLYAILLGFLARAILRRQTLRLPPLSGWILAFTVVVLVQVVNPADEGIGHTLGALRPHLEFVPLFFVGYYMVQTRARLRTFFLILLVIATANGIVGFYQLNLTPAQLASWGPGYAFRINGNGTGLNKVAGRTFHTGGQERTRPFGLSDDAGLGGAWGMLAVGGALALASLGIRRRLGRISLLLCVGPPLAIISGEGRSILIGSVVAVLAYVGFATTARRLVPTMTAVLLGLAVLVGVVVYVGSVSGSGVFARYKTISPSNLASTTSTDRGSSLKYIPTLIADHPLGNGLGKVGPAAGFAGGASNSGSNGETEPDFLVSELGVPGLIVVLGFNINLLFLAFRRIRQLEPETRSLVAALLAGIVAMLVVGVASATTANAPDAPYLWFAGGALSYWLGAGARSVPLSARVSADGPPPIGA